jgi:hypothetical protein
MPAAGRTFKTVQGRHWSNPLQDLTDEELSKLDAWLDAFALFRAGGWWERVGWFASRVAMIKIGAKVVSHGRYVAFQMAEVAIPRQMFQQILWLIAELRPQPPPAPA